MSLTSTNPSRIERALSHALALQAVLHAGSASDEIGHRRRGRALHTAHGLTAAAERLGDAGAMALFKGTALVLEHAGHLGQPAKRAALARELARAGLRPNQVEDAVGLAARLLASFSGSVRGVGLQLVQRVPVRSPVYERGGLIAYAVRFQDVTEAQRLGRVVSVLQPFGLGVDEVLLGSGRSIRCDVLEQLAEGHLSGAGSSAFPLPTRAEQLREEGRRPGERGGPAGGHGEEPVDAGDAQGAPDEPSRRTLRGTTLFLRPDKRRRLKALAAAAGLDLSEYVERALRL